MDPAAGVFPPSSLSESGGAPSGRVLPSHLFPGFATPKRSDSYAASETPSRSTSTRSPYVSGRLDFGYSDRPATTLPVVYPERSRGGFASPSAQPFVPPVAAAASSPKTPSSDRYGPPTDSLYAMLSAPAAKQQPQPPATAGGAAIAAPPVESLSPMRRDMFLHEVAQPPPAAVAAGAAPAPAPEAESCWVTVFGFSPTNSSFVLRHFQDVGTVLQHRPSYGNWMHLQFASPLEAQVALSKNGKVLGGVLMIGVAKCTDRDVMSSSKEAEPRVVRRAAYDPSRDPLATREIPQERNSLWSKTLEHVFGM